MDSSFFKDIVYLFLERGREKERERNIQVWFPLVRPLLGPSPATQVCALNENQTGDPLVHRPALDPLSHTSLGSKWILLSHGAPPLLGVSQPGYP